MNFEKILPNPKAKSSVWEHFGFPADKDGNKINDKKIMCRLCKGIVAYLGNTSNLTYHLSKQHTSVFSELRKPGESSKDLITAKSKSGSGKQLTLTAAISNSTLIPHDSVRHRELVNATANFICHSLQPVRIVDEDSFRYLFYISSVMDSMIPTK